MPLPKDPTKIEEWKRKNSESHKGKHHSAETIKKLSEINKGENNHFYGKKHSKETKRKLSESHKGQIGYWKGRIKSKEHIQKIADNRREKYIGKNNHNYGKKLSLETRKKISEHHADLSGKKHPFFNKHHTEESKRKISLSLMGKMVGEKNYLYGKYGKEHPGWKGGPLQLNCNFCKKNFFRNRNKIKSCKFHFCSPECKQKFLIGENNPIFGKYGPLAPNWLGGKSFEPYTIDFNNQFKEVIRERDNRCCVVCNKPEEALIYKLTVHHVDYNKKNSFYQNCISLCRFCHIQTNINRESWKAYFQDLLKRRYSYEYTEDQKIILDFTKDKEEK